jgi:hypothetical protein
MQNVCFGHVHYRPVLQFTSFITWRNSCCRKPSCALSFTQKHRVAATHYPARGAEQSAAKCRRACREIRTLKR